MSSQLRLGAKVPNSGQLPIRLGIARMAQRLESAGFQSVWISDHVVFPQEVHSRYPFAADGRVTWPLDADYIEPVVGLGAMTSVTSSAELGTSVLILPMRNPVLFAKQAACIDAMSGGRLVLGVGAGWLREEFEALGADFDSRGSVLDEWLKIARDCWTGSVQPFEGRHYRLPMAIHCRPTPARHVPVLIGGMSRHALERAGRIADGWLAQYAIDELSEERLGRGVEALKAAASAAGRRREELDRFRVVVRVTGADRKLASLGNRLESLAAAGATELIVDVDWDGEDGPRRSFETLRSAAS
ncbi:MAG TPA: TIGR03619 family F420-dependent LLM class oxidoreductase [Candidatus Dormibacteraeota bacterium]|nr:TIGR03619 family F420-dependent LLM class oxidoreductase [Candidatus Dormibacteraeota bacterium]